jgi:general secretion pathway protein E
VLQVDPSLHRLIVSNVADAELESAARNAGMATMYEAGIAKACRGQTTVEEVLRVTRVS